MRIDFEEINSPDDQGFWKDEQTGQEYGGAYVSPLLFNNLKKVEEGFRKAMKDEKFLSEMYEGLNDFIGINTPILYSKKLTQLAGGEQKIGKIFLKRTDLHHDSSHKPVNAFCSVLLAKYLGFKRIKTETGASMNARAVASACALLDMECDVYIGALDAQKVSLNKDITELYGANIIEVHDSSKTLLPAMAAALRGWQNDPDAMYVVGSVAGPHPYPLMVRTFASIIGRITKKQMIEKTGRNPDNIFAVCGGGSNLSGIAYPFYNDSEVNIFGVESEGEGINTDRHAATLTSKSKVGILLGAKAPVLMNDDGQVRQTKTEASGLDFASCGPEVAAMVSRGRIQMRSTKDIDAQKTFLLMTEQLGILPAIEACYVIHAALEEIKKRKNSKENHLIHLCGSGESNVARMLKFKRDNG